MNLILLFALLFLACFALFWGGALVFQGYFYQQPAELLPARAAGGAALVSVFLTFWVSIDRRVPEKYDTFFNFAGEKRTEFTEFEAVRWTRVAPKLDEKGQPSRDVTFRKNTRGEPEETIVKYHRPGGKTAPFLQVGTEKSFQLSGTFDGAEQMTVAVIVKVENEPVRFKAILDEDKRTGGFLYPREEGRQRFVDDSGDRYIASVELTKPKGASAVNSSNTGAILVALVLNFLLFVVWFVALWPILRFALWHAVGLAIVFGLMTMLVVMPLLFKPNRAKAEATPAPGAMPPPAIIV